eukprot:2695672-Pleurochrysis_carterae.AAC.2
MRGNAREMRGSCDESAFSLVWHVKIACASWYVEFLCCDEIGSMRGLDAWSRENACDSGRKHVL